MFINRHKNIDSLNPEASIHLHQKRLWSRSNVFNSMRSFLFLLFALIGMHIIGFAQEGYDGGVERTQVVRISGLITSDTSLPLQLNYTKDNNYEVSKKIKNIITLSVIEETPDYIPGNFSANVRLRIYYGHHSFSEDSVDTSLTVTYNNTAGAKYNAKAYLSINNAEYAQVTILGINAPVIGSGFNTRAVLQLQNEMDITRYYRLAANIYPTSVTAIPDTSYPAVPDALNINWQWPDTAGNNYTQLEWTWLENELQANYLYSGVLDTALLFKNNASRVDLPLNTVNYNIPLFYDGTGILFYRLRAVSLTSSGTEVTGPWSAVDTFAFAGHNNNLNWQVNTSYAEEGKRKTVIQYYDGTLRNRQTVTKDNTTNTTITAETFYDAQGRPAIQVLPAPGINDIVAYTANLNRFNGQPDNTDPAKYFDLEPAHAPNAITPGMNDSSGAAQYYSSSNPELNDSINKNVPDADSFAYTVTRYTPDATGRILYQSGVGDSLKMGSGHERKYYYGTPAQEELDGLFGTEVGENLHYFENMVQDANGQMSVSYVDMHGRTVATALAGDSPASLDTLDIHNGNDYLNQAGTQIVRNLLDSGSNIVKNNLSIESVNSLLASSTTTFHFNYHFPARTLELPVCNIDSPDMIFNCIYNLAITITDESGDNAPIALNYSSNIDSVSVSDSITLPIGSYSVRKTLTISQAIQQQYDSVFSLPGKGFCSTMQDIIDSVKTAMETQSGCGDSTVVVTCQACLDSLGSFSTFEEKYDTSIGVTYNNLTPAQYNDIRTSYIGDSSHCQMLSTTVSHTLDDIKQAMLADMMPYSGQYAQDPDSPSTVKGTMYNKYNIFAATNLAFYLPFYKAPVSNDTHTQSVYYNSQGDTDLTVTPVLSSLSPSDFESIFNPAWANQLLLYHPEYGELLFAEDSLQTSYNWEDNLSQIATYSQARDSGYDTNIILHDPFFSLTNTSSYRSLMDSFVISHWQQGLSLWQYAYSSIMCNSITDSVSRGSCAIGAPKTPPSGGYTGLTTAQQDQLWTVFQNMYLQVRADMVNGYIGKYAPSPNPDSTALVDSGYILHFPSSNKLLAKELGWNWYPSTPGAAPNVNIQDSANAVSAGYCLSYVPNWQQQLLQCSVLAGEDSATQATILNEITTRMVAVCQRGTDPANAYGSSDIPPGAAPVGTYSDTSFEQIITSVYAANGIGKDQYCNPYVITFPKPYGKNPIFIHSQTPVVDTCNCKQFAQILYNAHAAGADTSSLSSLNGYLETKYGDTLTIGMFAGLQHCSELGKRDSVLVHDTVTKIFYATTSLNDSVFLDSSGAHFYGVKDTVTDKIVTSIFASDYPLAINSSFKFDSIVTIPDSVTVLSATMNLYADPDGFNPPAHPAAHSAVSPDTTALELNIPDHFYWNKNTSADSLSAWLGESDMASDTIHLTSPFQDVTFNAMDYLEEWRDIGNYGIMTFMDFESDTLSYATFCSNTYPDTSKRPKLTVMYTFDTTAIDTSSYYYLLPQPQPLPEFLKCGFNLNNGPNCYSCTQLATLTTKFKTYFAGTPDSIAPVFDSSGIDSNTISYNVLYARYLNYQTGMEYNWTDYANAVSAAGCNLYTGTASDSTVICASTKALTDTAGLDIPPVSPCAQTDAFATNAGQNIYQLRMQHLLASFDSGYIAKALGVQEKFTVTYMPKEYHYTLYYYDEAGNLVKTVPPKGVHPDFNESFTDSVEAAKLINAILVPSHTYATNYRYNTLNQVVTQKTPDADTSHFWYDRLGRLVISQNSKQALSNNYSYTLYDSLGRITEVGEKPQTTAMTQAISQDTASLRSWLSGGSYKEQITYTVYDTAYSPISGVLLTQQNLRNRVSYTATKNVETDALPYTATYYTYDIHGNVDTLVQDYKGLTAMSGTQNRFKTIAYNYDLISGKVNAVGYQPGQPDAFYHLYQYDAENRLTNVLTSRDSIIWEQEAAYSYYKHGPLARTVLGQLQVQGVDYSYTLQGWLKGINQVFSGRNTISDGMGCYEGTGTDTLLVNYRSNDTPFVYSARYKISFTPGFSSANLDSFHTNLNDSLPPCTPIPDTSSLAKVSGCAGCELPPVAADVYSLSLHYYPGDYKAINGAVGPAVLETLGSSAAPLFNGNIAAMAVNIPKLGNPLAYNYHYEQLNRITKMDAYTGLTENSSGNASGFSPVVSLTPIDDYKERVSYDPNGNITKYLRNGVSSVNLAMDSLTYNYSANTNQLDHVDDSVSNTNYTEDIDDQSTANYKYDAIGNLISDVQGGIDSVYWTVYGKISRIKKTSGTIITYTYDASGNRISKAVVPTSGIADTTVYVRDASGNIMTVYDKTDSLRQTELDMYGSSRLGTVQTNLNVQRHQDSLALGGDFGSAKIDTFTRGFKFFELTNHLGNVLATVSDKKLAVDSNSDGVVDYYTADVASATDFSSYGAGLEGRKFNDTTAHYGFNGQMKVPEIGADQYTAEYWEYDSRIARRWNLDPKGTEWESPYDVLNDDPLWNMDELGDSSHPIVITTPGKTTSTQHVVAQIGDLKDFKDKVKSGYQKSLKPIGERNALYKKNSKSPVTVTFATTKGGPSDGAFKYKFLGFGFEGSKSDDETDTWGWRDNEDITNKKDNEHRTGSSTSFGFYIPGTTVPLGTGQSTLTIRKAGSTIIEKKNSFSLFSVVTETDAQGHTIYKGDETEIVGFKWGVFGRGIEGSVDINVQSYETPEFPSFFDENLPDNTSNVIPISKVIHN